MIRARFEGGPWHGTEIDVQEDRPRVIALLKDGGGYVRMDARPDVFVWALVPTAEEQQRRMRRAVIGCLLAVFIVVGAVVLILWRALFG